MEMESVLVNAKENFNFCGYSSQQFATVLFDRDEDAKEACITIIYGKGRVYQKIGDNRFNPSYRRHSVCTYVFEECDYNKVIKICTVQHKGTTLQAVHTVPAAEMEYLFGELDKKILFTRG